MQHLFYHINLCLSALITKINESSLNFFTFVSHFNILFEGQNDFNVTNNCKQNI